MDVSIKDVARHCRVSPTTVSRVLNHNTLVKEVTRKKVLKAIEELHYVPNASAKNLRSQKTMTIGVIVSDVSVPYYAEIIKGIQHVAYTHKYKVVICDTENDAEKEREYMKLLVDRSIDGLILVTSMLGKAEILQIVNKGYKVGLIGRQIQDDRILTVYTDNIKAAQQAVEHLIELGHRQIAFISGFAHSVDSYDRLEGYLKALKEHEIPFRPELIENGNFIEQGGYDAFMRLMERGVYFTAVFCANDEMAFGVYNACKEQGIRIPEDLAVFGVDNNRMSRYITPALSSINQPKYEMGSFIAKELIRQLNEEGDWEPRTFKLESNLIIRASSNYQKYREK